MLKALTLLYICALSSSLAEDGLRNLFILWRHGDRAPYGNNIGAKPSFDELWPWGIGQLTDTGVQQQYKLGAFLRQKYQDFIPQNYSYRHYHVRSSDYDRTLMSALSNLAGFFNQSFSPLTSNLPFNWRPIPVHTVQKSREALFSNEPCKRLTTLIKEDENSAEAQELFAKHKSTLDTIEKQLGRKPSVRDLTSMYDEVVCLRHHNYSLPAWVNQDVITTITEIDDFFWHARMHGKERLMFEVGVFLHNMFDHMLQLIKTGNVSISIDGDMRPLAQNHIMAYSAHDTNVAPLMASFGMEQPGTPDYTACVMIELLGPPFPGHSKDYRLRIWYKNSYKDTEARVIPFRTFCQGLTECPFDTVMREMSAYFIKASEYKDRCDATTWINRNYALSVILIILGVIAFMGLISVGYILFKRQNRNPQYMTINDVEPSDHVF